MLCSGQHTERLKFPRIQKHPVTLEMMVADMYAAMQCISTAEAATHLRNRYPSWPCSRNGHYTTEPAGLTLAIDDCERCTPAPAVTSGSSDGAVSDMHVHCQTHEHVHIATRIHRRTDMIARSQRYDYVHRDLQYGTCRRSAVKLPPLHMTDCAAAANRRHVLMPTDITTAMQDSPESTPTRLGSDLRHNNAR